MDVCVEEIVSLLDEAMKDLPLRKIKREAGGLTIAWSRLRLEGR